MGVGKLRETVRYRDRRYSIGSSVAVGRQNGTLQGWDRANLDSGIEALAFWINLVRVTVMKYAILLGASAAIFVATVSAFAVGLSETDFAYLTTQNIERNSPPLHNLSPKEQARLHSLINDPRTANDPAAQAKLVNEALVEFLDHQLWERLHPGQLWDAPKR